jgi:hypothetical protein
MEQHRQKLLLASHGSLQCSGEENSISGNADLLLFQTREAQELQLF